MKILKEALKENKLIIGTERTLKNLRMGKLKRIYLASTIKKDTKEDIEHYAKIFGVKIINLKENNEELGLICKKRFNVSVLSF